MITLNIGSAIAGKDKALAISTVFNRLEASDLTPFQFRTEVSATETTYVVCVTTPSNATLQSLDSLIADISDGLQQDCIAWTWAPGSGLLSGPRALDWNGGKFNPDYFIAW